MTENEVWRDEEGHSHGLCDYSNVKKCLGHISVHILYILLNYATLCTSKQPPTKMQDCGENSSVLYRVFWRAYVAVTVLMDL
jgi:hypothetical protein